MITRVEPNVTGGVGSAELYKSVARGAFIQVGGQRFRVCLSTVVDDVGSYSADSIPLCRVDAPFEPAFYYGSGYAHELKSIAAFLLDTDAGSGSNLGVGDSTLQTMSGPYKTLRANNLTTHFERGDMIRIGQ